MSAVRTLDEVQSQQELRIILDRLVGLQARIERASTPEEAAAAASLLQAQMAKYNLSAMELRSRTDKHGAGSGRAGRKASEGFANAPVDFGSSTGWLTDWKTWILQSVAEANYGTTVLHTRPGQPTQATIIARDTSILYIVSMYEYLMEAVRRMANESFEQYGKAVKATKSEYRLRKWKSSFYLGAANKIRERLMWERTEQEKLAGASAGALVTLEDAQLDKAIDELFPNLRKRQPKTVSVDYAGYEHGQKAGDRVNLDPQIKRGV